ncbi:unnamed protein product [Symbiodinium microadriaticum]|nr:unnamed protein product [Symbiodinium microadriaticum]
MAAACRAIGQACQPVAAATSVVRSARGPKLPTRCGNVTADVDMPQPMLDSWMLEPQCTMFRQYPGLAMLSDCAATPAPVEQAAAAEALDAPAVQEASERPEPAEGLQDEAQGDPSKQERRKARERRAPVTAAAMVMRDYEMRLRSLEVQCRELSSQNARLSSELTAGEVKQQQGRELNLRLSREVQELRRLNAEANDKVMALEEERATQRDLPAAQTDDVQPVQPLTASHLLEVVEFVEPPPGLAGLEPVAMSQSYAPIEEPELFWGCEQTQIYSASLLLAHRDLALRADLGPPGLEHPAMDGLRAEEVPDVISRKIWRPRKLQDGCVLADAGAYTVNGINMHESTMAKTYEGLASLARETADATAAAAVMVGDAQKNAHVLKEILDKLQCKAKAKKERSNDEDDEAKDADTSSDEEGAETKEDRACSNRRLLLKLNTEVLDLQKEMRNLISSNPALMPEVGVAQKEWIFRLAAELIEQTKWKFTMLGLHGQHGPSTWDEAMQETLYLLQAAANWDGFASPLFDARILRVAALVDANLLSKMLQDALQVCEDSTPPSAGDADDRPSHARHQYSEAVNLLCRHGTAETVAVQA